MFSGKIRYAGLKLPTIPRKFRDVSQQALMETVVKWHEETAPGHFTVQAFSKYGGRELDVFGQRKKNKRPNRGGTGSRFDYVNPLVWSGALRRAFLGRRDLKPTGSGVNLKVKARWPTLPKYAYYTKYGKNRAPGPAKHKELTIMTAPERNASAKHFAKRTEELLGKAGET